MRNTHCEYPAYQLILFSITVGGQTSSVTFTGGRRGRPQSARCISDGSGVDIICVKTAAFVDLRLSSSALLLALSIPAVAATTCENRLSLKLKDATVTVAQRVAAGSFKLPGPLKTTGRILPCGIDAETFP